MVALAHAKQLGEGELDMDLFLVLARANAV